MEYETNNNQLQHVLQILDIVVVVLNMIFLGQIEIGLYSAITIYIVDKMLDLIFEGINFSKMIKLVQIQLFYFFCFHCSASLSTFSPFIFNFPLLVLYINFKKMTIFLNTNLFNF